MLPKERNNSSLESGFVLPSLPTDLKPTPTSIGEITESHIHPRVYRVLRLCTLYWLSCVWKLGIRFWLETMIYLRERRFVDVAITCYVRCVLELFFYSNRYLIGMGSRFTCFDEFWTWTLSGWILLLWRSWFVRAYSWKKFELKLERCLLFDLPSFFIFLKFFYNNFFYIHLTCLF